MTAALPISVLLSGGGRTALNLLECIERGELAARIVGAIASRADAPGVARLRARGVAVDVVARCDFADETALHDRTDELLVRSGTELVCLCGWLRKFRVVASATASTRVDAPGTIAASEPRGAATGDHAGSGSRPRAARLAAPRVDWTMRAMNIHPSLLPAFGGVGMHGDRVHAAVLASGATHSGCTVHYVDDQYDHGPIVVQRVVPVLPGDDVAALAARVFAEERIAYPEAIRMHIAGAACPARA